jgi:multimeric flavodoxin WrbA
LSYGFFVLIKRIKPPRIINAIFKLNYVWRCNYESTCFEWKPEENGTVATLLRAIAEGAKEKHEVEWIDLYNLEMKPCIACMKCRPDNVCILPQDSAHKIGEKIREAGALIVGTPTHWGNMSTQLKMLFDRNVPVFMGGKGKRYAHSPAKGKICNNRYSLLNTVAFQFHCWAEQRSHQDS